MKFRKEYDSIGNIKVPSDKYWGASTERSKKFFDIGEIFVQKILIKSIAIIKKSAAAIHKNQKHWRFLNFYQNFCCKTITFTLICN